MDKYSDWVDRINQGDTEAFSRIFNEFWDSLFAVAYNRIKSKEDVEEILQEIFSDIWKRRESLVVKVSLPAYLHMALKYKIYNYIHAQKLRKAYSTDHPSYLNRTSDSTQEILAFEELYEQLQKGLEKLPEKCRLVFKMSREELKSAPEIAKELNISHRTVQTHIHHALKFLKEELSDYRLAYLPFLLFLPASG